MRKVASKSWDSNRITALLAMFVSVCALFVSVYQVQLERRQQYASVWPSLLIYTMTQTKADSSQNKSAFVLTNKGIGPAIVERVQIWYKRRPCKDESDLVAQLFGAHQTNGGEINQIWPERVIAANEQFNWIAVEGYSDVVLFQVPSSAAISGLKYVLPPFTEKNGKLTLAAMNQLCKKLPSNA